MAKRLNKVTREFNVGISTIVDFLANSGHEIDSNPNTKIPDELYDLLEKEFSSESSLKEKSKEIDLSENRKKQEVISIEEVEEEAHAEKEEVEEETPEPEVGIKVVGKVDLEGFNRKPKTPKKKEAPKPKPEPTKEIVEEAPKPETIPEPEIEVAVEKTTEPEVIEETIVSEIIEETPTPDKEESETKAKKEDDVFVSSKAEVEDNVKVIGKIDLSTINQKTRPDRKSKKEKEQERKDRKEKNKPAPRAEKPSAPGQAPARGGKKKPEQEVYRANVKKINQPNVVGKINIEPGSDSDKPKRKRIKKGKVDVSKGGGNSFDPFSKGPKQAPKKGKKGVRKGEEVSGQAVDKQIKDTMARMSGKKSKSAKYRRDKRDAVRQEIEDEAEKGLLEDKVIKVTEFISANDLSRMMEVDATEIISTCMSIGMFVSLNQRLDAETISMIVEEFGFTVEFVSAEIQESIEEVVDKPEDLLPRPPIVTVMGHVDHGKTSLLDYVRKANVIAGEAGGITQHIGAYSVTMANDKKITFLDTPGHEAFTAMRARGAQVTDVVIIVVAADDNVMPQTKEAINHAAAAGVPIIFAINKVDKDGANPDRIREELSQMNYLVEDWGGKYQSQEISAKFGNNVDELMEKVLLEAEMLELKANPNRKATGTVIESELDKGRGYVSTILVSGGTLRVGDIILAGMSTGKVKAMFNERNQKITEAGPATPVTILGLDGAPQAGDNFNVMPTEREARVIASKREQLQREQQLNTQRHITLDEIGRRIAIGNFQELNIIIKGDVDGSVEALADSLVKLSTPEIQVNVKHKAVGQISESDVLLASASDAIIIGFQVRPSAAARRLAETEAIDIRLYSIIYSAIEELKDAMTGMLSPEIKEEITGTVEIREVFKISKVGTIAGCFVTDGKIFRNSKIRIIREGIVVYTGDLGSLKRFKDDVKDVAKGYECGLNINNFNDIREGDIVEAYEEKEVKRKL